MNSFLRKLFSSKVLPSWVILILDIAIVLASVVFAFLLRYSPSEVQDHSNDMWLVLGLVMAFNLLFFNIFHTFNLSSNSC